MKCDINDIRDFFFGHKFSSYRTGSYHYVCDICNIMVFAQSATSIVLVNKLHNELDFEAEILDCKTQQIKNLLE
jgi:hypothetical protein